MITIADAYALEAEADTTYCTVINSKKISLKL